MENIWFYTLSTIAQVMAATAGLFAVFVVFKLDKSAKDIEELRRGILKHIIAGVDNFYKESNQNILDKAREFVKVQTEQGSLFIRSVDISLGVTVDLNQALNLFEGLIENKRQIIEKLRNVLIFSIAYILILIFSLGLTQYSVNSFLLYAQLMLGAMLLPYIGYSIYEISKN